MRNPELFRLRRLAHEHGFKVKPGSRDGLYHVGDDIQMLAGDITEQELRGLLAGTISLGQLRQPPR